MLEPIRVIEDPKVVEHLNDVEYYVEHLNNVKHIKNFCSSSGSGDIREKRNVEKQGGCVFLLLTVYKLIF